jgi:membrane protein DedA with SNARE-associated domain
VDLIAELLAGPSGYFVLLALLLITAVGSPIPEDLLLLGAGFLVGTGDLQWLLVAPVALAGVVGSDLLLFVVGRRIGWRAPPDLDGSFLASGHLARATAWFDRLGAATIFWARLLPGTRALVFATAGLRGVPTARFLAMDALGAILWIPLMLVAGIRFGEHVGGIASLVAWVASASGWVTGIALLLFVAWFAWGREESKL